MIDSTASAPAARRLLPLWETLRWAYGSVFGQPVMVSRALATPLALILANYAIQWWLLAGHEPGEPASGMLVLWRMVGGLLHLLSYLLACVAWHRFIALGPEVGRPPWIPVIARRHWRFLGYAFLIWLIFSAIAVAVAVSVNAAGLAPFSWPRLPPEFSDADYLRIRLLQLASGAVIGTLIVYPFARVCLVLPAAALDRCLSLVGSIKATSSFGLNLAAAFWLAALPNGLFNLLATLLAGRHSDQMARATYSAMALPLQAGDLAIGLLTSLVGYLVVLAGISIVCRTFVITTDFEPDAAVFPWGKP